MAPAQQSTRHITLEEVERLFQNWRAERKPKSRIPNELWQAAASLSENYSVNYIARTLRLSHAVLKEHIATQNSKSGKNLPLPKATFLELPALQATHRAECLVEMENRQGEKMRMHFSGEVNLDLFALSKSFWESRP